MHPMLNTAVKAARRAGQIINRASQNLDSLTIKHKSFNDFVSEVDQKAEDAIKEVLLEAYPKHAILAEESGAQGDSEFQWIIDPLDGTTMQHKGVLTNAVIYDPSRNDLFTASRGAGAFLNDRRLRVSRCEYLKDALIGTGFPFRDFTHLDTYLGIFRELMQKTAGLRRPGSAALDLAYTAAGRFDGFFEFDLKAWDIAAGALMVQEAGGLVGDFQGDAGYLQSGNILAGNPKVFGQLLQTITTHLAAKDK